MIKYLFIAMRPHQWLKNIFIVFPLVFGKKMTDPILLSKTVLMFIAFSFLSSAMYLINDVIDLEEDKQHPEKLKRPLASGKVTVKQTLLLASVLCLGSVFFIFAIDAQAGIVAIFYLALNYAYMRYLKHAVIIDVFCIGSFFYIRILLGGIASGVVLSNWIIMCTVLLALFLAFNKRRYDLEFSKEQRPVFSKYSENFIDRMISVVSATLIGAYAFYVMDEQTILRFGTNHLIFSIPFVYYGLFRYLYLIDTKWYGGDPSKILIKDYKLQIDIVFWVIVCVGVIYFRI